MSIVDEINIADEYTVIIYINMLIYQMYIHDEKKTPKF